MWKKAASSTSSSTEPLGLPEDTHLGAESIEVTSLHAEPKDSKMHVRNGRLSL